MSKTQRYWKWGRVLLAASFVIFCACLPAAAAGSANKQLTMPKPAVKDKCPVCGMFVAKYPDWVMAVRFRDGSHVYFDGAKDMFKYLFDLKRYAPSRKAADIQTILVRDYYHLSAIDARKALYIIGSDIYGPMGRELIPLAHEDDAREFSTDHQGKKILKFSEITAEVVKSLDQ
ncbi:MAG: nitrous oxide reductase accessory protein NosL [Deltaproteobacteria bacterium HGW-Deltaproteobacteria-6]|jgi:nitrous oxide reductase accessory protein NosL|nr:MAG: nitrous oxide reductase accessory protein NosL [Deltaproteobacteria bacterium HGW-Deltaproteobacteria-6]